MCPKVCCFGPSIVSRAELQEDCPLCAISSSLKSTRNVGPNVLMSSDDKSSSTAIGLWSLPPASVLNLSAGRQQKKQSHQTEAASAEGPSGVETNRQEERGSSSFWGVPLGRATVAQQLGLADDEAPVGPSSDREAKLPEELRGAAGAVESGVLSGFQMAASAGAPEWMPSGFACPSAESLVCWLLLCRAALR